MNCCDYDCIQGRYCPARVAKCKPVMLAAEPLPPSTWRMDLRIWVWLILTATVALPYILLPYILLLTYFALRE